MSRHHIVYRAYDQLDRLLYVGLTAQPGIRLRKHAQKKAWWREVSRVEFEHHRSRDAAEIAERKAIADELPLYNIQYSSPEQLAQLQELHEELYGDDELENADESEWVLVEYDGPEVDCTALGLGEASDHLWTVS